MVPAAAANAVSLQLDGLSTSLASTKLCLAVTKLPGAGVDATARSNSAGAYTNATILAECKADDPAQLFVYDSTTHQLTHALSTAADGAATATGCLDCAHCQDGPHVATAWLFTPCFGGPGHPSANEQLTYDKDLETLVTPFNGKCLAACPAAAF